MNGRLFGGTDSLARRGSALKLSARLLASGIKSGSFRSLYRGEGVEFSGVREYLCSDDVRSIDWNVTARMGHPFVKLFAEDRELSVFLIVDRSLSMRTPVPARLKTACEAAALVSFACEAAQAPVGALFFDSRVRFLCAPRSGRAHVSRIVNALDELRDAGRGSALPESLSAAARLLRRRSLVLIFSDFRVAGWEEAAGILASKHSVTAVRIEEGAGRDPGGLGGICFEDAENGATLFAPASASAFLRAWREDERRRVHRWYAACASRGLGTLAFQADEDPLRPLARFFARGGTR